MDKIWWNEQWMGWPLGPHYEASSNIVNAGKLQGHLMLVIGEFDTNVDPVVRLSGRQRADPVGQVLRSARRAERRSRRRAASTRSRKRNDFFVQWLLGVQPPNWNQGVTDAARWAARLEFPPEPQMEPSFYDGPNDPPYVWW